MDHVGIDRQNPNPPRGDVAEDVIMARRTLEEARSALDLAVAALPDVGGDEAMATPALLSLLVGAVRAKEHLIKLEGRLARESEEVR